MSHKAKIRVILSGGGTGGHIYPAIAIADEIKKRYADNAEILFVGAKNRMEMTRVPKAGYPIKGLWISGLQRKLSFQNMLFPIKLIYSMIQSFCIIRSFRPDIVIGTGGYASAALLRMAQILGIPNIIQEQNSYAGLTNKWLGKGANAVCVAYDNMERFFPAKKVIKTGNPIRGNVLKISSLKDEATAFFGMNKSSKKLLIIGGSLGAREINKLINNELDFILSLGIEVIWQCGSLYYDQYKKYDNGKSVRVFPFIDRMDYAYAASDLIISRSGASSVSELCVIGKPVIFIPSPNVAEDHQTKNAQALSFSDAAIVLKENELYNKFRMTFQELVSNDTLQTTLSKNIKLKAQPYATEHIVNEIENHIKTR